jgi:hypothetical protein
MPVTGQTGRADLRDLLKAREVFSIAILSVRRVNDGVNPLYGRPDDPVKIQPITKNISSGFFQEKFKKTGKFRWQ